jgi:hypothetical protein
MKLLELSGYLIDASIQNYALVSAQVLTWCLRETGAGKGMPHGKDQQEARGYR